ncbi:MAG: SUMF1/EgtB/PvdO family nonheme iron enzyme [Nitrospira sp.]|nr:SUMF1/EgtB/PvdO family nonheme iron enzyme [Nitrospira sp.]
MTEPISYDYDVFLSYHRRDCDLVERIAQSLRERGLKPFLDRWYLVPGRPWPKALEQTLASCRAVAVCIGPGEMGAWQAKESHFALNRQEREVDFPVIPVLLPGSDPALGFLGQNTWVDLRQGIDDPRLLSLLAGAIRGEVPGPEFSEQIKATRSTLCPYRGLEYFREEDSPFFFGRKAAIQTLYETVRDHRFISVVGASGSGKSSIVRAGLLPQLRQEKERIWDVVTLFPGSEPLKALAWAVSPLFEPETVGAMDRVKKIKNLADAFAKKDITLHDVGQSILERKSGTDRLLLVIDHAEELYTVANDDCHSRRFIDDLLEASGKDSWTVMLTLRGDFVGRALSYRPLSDRLQDAQVNLGPMTRAELEQAITSPASRVELIFADGLVNRILDDVGDEPGNLPLLEFVLKRLWEERQGPELSHQSYEAMGRLQGAVATKAEEVFKKFSPLAQAAVKRVFLQVVRAGETREDTSRRAALSEIEPTAMDVVKKLTDERLLVTNRALAGEETVEVSHEALIRKWQRLQGWLKEDRGFLLWREGLRGRVNDWQHNKYDDSTLLRGTLLGEAQRWISQRADMLTDSEKNYIRQSVEVHDRAVRDEEERIRRELAQAQRLAEEATKREEAERARAAAAEQAQRASEEAREAEKRRAEASEGLRRQRRRFRLMLLTIFLIAGWTGWLVTWLTDRHYGWNETKLKIRSIYSDIHQDPEKEMEMILIQGGTFRMGDLEEMDKSEDSNRRPTHPVTIKSFYMGKYEVTFDEYDRYAISKGKPLPTDQGWGRGKRPVINVSWEDANEYAKWLKEKTGKPYRLATESEWEYAARNGDMRQAWAGTSDPNELSKYAVFSRNSGSHTGEVGNKDENGFGLYDLSGNVFEWVEDCAHDNYKDAPEDGSAWLEKDKGDCTMRMHRGGSWDNVPMDLRASHRGSSLEGSRSSHLGFRLAKDLKH